jgi:hypothetical protein
MGALAEFIHRRSRPMQSEKADFASAIPASPAIPDAPGLRNSPNSPNSTGKTSNLSLQPPASDDLDSRRASVERLRDRMAAENEAAYGWHTRPVDGWPHRLVLRSLDGSTNVIPLRRRGR